MIRLIDVLLNRITTYRLLLYHLISLILLAAILAIARVIPISPGALLSTAAIYLAVTLCANWVFARLFRVDANRESTIITAVILTLISGPVSIASDPVHAGYLALAGLFAVASKYLLAIRRQHIFNPAAFGIFLTGILFGQYSTWWVGNIAMLPLVVVGGLLVLRKMNRFRMAGLFFAAQIVFLFAQGIWQGIGAATALASVSFAFLRAEIVFAAVVMVTEPLTSPKVFPKQAVYAVITAFFFLPQINIYGFAISPEAALLIGNLFSYLASPGFKLVLRLKERREIGPNIMAFTFAYPRGFKHKLGQYMEWTIPLRERDSRGNRRCFSIASSPTESELMIAVRFHDDSSAYKRAMATMRPGDRMVAAELGGEFVLPSDPSEPLAFIAGGIGITPFRSMIKYLVDTGERRSIVLLYANSRKEEIVFAELLKEAEEKIGVKVVYTLTDTRRVTDQWSGRIGPVSEGMIHEEVPDYRYRHFYVSGPLTMVVGVRSVLRSIGIRPSRIRTDLFSGYVA